MTDLSSLDLIYLLQIIFFAFITAFHICWYIMFNSKREQQKRKDKGKNVCVSEFKERTFFFFWMNKRLEIFFAHFFSLCMARECYITSFSFRTEKGTHHSLVAETRLNLHYNEFSWVCCCIFIRLCCFWSTSNNILNTFPDTTERSFQLFSLKIMIILIIFFAYK